MESSFKKLSDFVEKSVDLDPWVDERGIKGYCEELELEAKEVLEAVRKDDTENFKEELGDVLMDWMHICIMAEKEGHLTVKEVIDSSIEKFDKRKPFLKENKRLTIEECRRIWLEAKKKEKA